MRFYTNVERLGNKILVRGIENGKPFRYKDEYSPYLFIPTNKKTQYKDLKGNSVGKVDFPSMSEARDFLTQYDNVAGMEIFGLTDFKYLFIHDAFPGEVKYDPSQIHVATIDIEVSIKGGYPEISTAQNEVTAITVSRNGIHHVFGCGDYTPHEPNIEYHHCKNEMFLLREFLNFWADDYPDVVTGWNVEFFDIPYLINRIKNVFDESDAKKLSPWGILREYDVEIRGRKNQAYTPLGVNVLDYINLYKKFTYSQQESYRLDHIAHVELGSRKLDYSEYLDLQDLYERNYQKYIEYNVFDVVLVEQLEDKMKLIELVYAMAYDAKINYEDTLGSVKQWDIIIHNYLLDQGLVIPQFKRGKDNKALVGGYVKQPKIGLNKWVVSFDLTSLYPHLIMQYNISPETFISRMKENLSIEDLIDGKMEQFHDYMDRTGTCMTANLCVYSKEKEGFLPALMEKLFNDRAVYKKKMLEAKRAYEQTKDESIKKQIAMYDNFQQAKKIQLNSAYGSLGNTWFRWFDFNHAEAITMSGQLSIRWIDRAINKFLNKTLKTLGKDYIIASDTDSIYITLDDLVKQVMPNETDKKKIVKFIDKTCDQILQPVIDKSYQELADYMRSKQKMKMKREAIADKGIWKAKKMYILNVWDLEGVAYDEPKLKMMGIEAVRSSTPSSCRDSIKKCLSIIMNKEQEDLHKYIRDFEIEFKNLSFEDVAFPRGVKDIEKWSNNPDQLYEKGAPIHVKGAIFFNTILKLKGLEGKYQPITSGEKIKFAYMKRPNPYDITVLSCSSGLPDEFALNSYVDYETQFEKAFLDPIKSITSTIGWTTEKVATLDNWFE